MSRLRAAFTRALFARTTGEAAALFRIALGLVALHYLLAGIGPNLERYYGEQGVVPFELWRAGGPHFSLLWLHPHRLTGAVWLGSVVAAAAVVLGYRSRLAVLCLYVGLASFQNRNLFVVNAGERLLCGLCLLSALAPLSIRWGLSAPRDGSGRGSKAGLWPARLQIVIVYFATFLHKLRDPAWRSGEAVERILRDPLLASYDGALVPPALARVLTFGTLVLEGLFFLALWKKARRWVLLGGIGLHLSIEALMIVPVFTAVMLASYLAFLDDAEARWLVELPRRLRARARPDPKPSAASA